MKRFAIVFGLILFLVWGVHGTDWVGHSFTQGPTIAGEAAIVIDERNGDVLFKKNENKRLFPASTTKIVTALVALEKADVDDVIVVGDEVLRQIPGESSARLGIGQALTLDDLLHAMLLPSGNDAARTIAMYVAREDSGNMNLPYEESERYFANLMNEKMKQIGANHSHFVNPHGLHDEEHYTTAFDLALIALEARKSTHLRNIVSEKAYEAASIQVTNRNQLLLNESEHYLPTATGMKTGFTNEAGYCLISSANGIISVVLNSTEERIYNDSKKLLSYGFSKLEP